MAKDKHLQSRNVVFLSLVFILATVRSEGNLAVYKTATQSSNHNPNVWHASAAVDGCDNNDITSGCCTHTAGNGPKEAWWRVDLGQTSTIDSIQIIYRGNFQQTFAAYELYVSNTTISPQDGILCYKDTSSTRSAVQLNVIHQCPYVGRYVTVYNYRNNPKRYSWYSDYAILELCEVLVYGCPVGSYGDGDCNQVCPATCYGGNCNPKTGSCLYCVDGKYGVTCGMDCSGNCKDPICDRHTGYCSDCIPGKFGDTCEQTCSVNCNSSGCIKDTGQCYECVAGTYGSSCGQACSVNCKDRVCTKTTGHCIECVTGKFGNICEQDCSVNCKDRLCVKDAGYCTECSLGKYGASCDRDCPDYCRDGCTRDNASCIGCTTGRYGSACTSTCPVTCKDFVCGQQTGQCLDCYPGKYGVVCGADCPDSCTDNICNKEDGQCLTQVDSNVIIIAVLAVVCGLLVSALIAAIICICWLRNKDKEKKSPNKTTDQSGLDTGYTTIDRGDVEPPNVYEMVVT